MTLPVYLGDDMHLAALLRAERLYAGFQRRGFFRIGVLPQFMADGVTLELHDAARCAEVLQGVPAKLRLWGNVGALEMRRVVVVFGAPTTTSTRLEAGRALCGQDGRWELLDGVVFQAGTNRVSAPSGRLQIVGPKAGRLELASDQAVYVHHLFQSLNNTHATTPAAALKTNKPISKDED